MDIPPTSGQLPCHIQAQATGHLKLSAWLRLGSAWLSRASSGQLRALSPCLHINMQDRCKVNIDGNRKENGITSDTSATTSNTSTTSPEISTPSCCRCLNRNCQIEESLAVMARLLTSLYMRKPSMLTGARR